LNTLNSVHTCVNWASVAHVLLHFFIRTRGSFFAENLRTIPASAEEQSLKL